MSRRFIFRLTLIFLAALLICSNNLYAQTSSKKQVKAQPTKIQPAKASAEPVKNVPAPLADPITVTKPVVNPAPAQLPWL
jgi:hypothetical protein